MNVQQTANGLREPTSFSTPAITLVRGAIFFGPLIYSPMKKEDQRFGKYLMVIKDQIGIHNVIDLKTDDEREANERAAVVCRLPYELNPMPSGGMGLGTYDVRTRRIPNWNLSTEGVDCAIELLRINLYSYRYKGGLPPGTTYEDWR